MNEQTVKPTAGLTAEAGLSTRITHPNDDAEVAAETDAPEKADQPAA